MLIKLKRDTGWADFLRPYKVLVDGKMVGEIKDGATESFAVPDDANALVLKIDWCTSNEVTLNLGEAELNFSCGSSLRGLKVFLGLFYVIFRKNQYLWLTPVGDTEGVLQS